MAAGPSIVAAATWIAGARVDLPRRLGNGMAVPMVWDAISRSSHRGARLEDSDRNAGYEQFEACCDVFAERKCWVMLCATYQ
jgi:hypothetical protein